MKLHRFIGDFNFKRSDLSLQDDELALQIQKVLRLKVGEDIMLGDGAGQEALCEITGFKKNKVEVRVKDVFENKNEPAVQTILYCAILRRENFELAVQKAVEAGVMEIIPLITTRTVKFNFKADRVRKIIREAAEQSGRGIVPQLHEALSFDEALEHSVHNTHNFFFHFGDKDISDEVGMIQKDDRVGIFIGPEGGWHDDEVKQAEQHGLTATSLGLLTLRAETAVTIATYLVAHSIK